MNKLKRILNRIFPLPHRPVKWSAGIPLMVFAVLFALISFSILPTFVVNLGASHLWTKVKVEFWGVEWLNFQWLADWNISKPVFEVVRELEFARPWAFWLLLFTPWIWWMQAAGHAGLPLRRGAFAGFCRLCICGLLILILAEPRAVRTSDVVSVVYNVDLSDSVNEARNEALELVAGTAAEKPTTDQAGLVVFGRTAAVEYPPRETFPFEKYINSRVSQDATNLEQSLALSAAMLPEENAGRIVLVSDGTETIGQLKDIISDLQSRDVRVDVVPIEYDYQHEVLLERLDLPRLVRLGETYEASVVLSSLAKGKGELVLSEGETTIARQAIEFEAGKSRYSVPIKVDQPGYYEYSARIEVAPGEDSRSENNEVRNYLYLEGPGRVLVVTDPQGKPADWEPMVLALKQGERNVEVLNALEFPYDPLSLMPYDAVIFVDVAADSMLGSQIDALHDAIQNLGLGFMMVGGPNSFGPGGWQGSAIDKALPLSMEITNKKILPKGALAIILHTCEFPQGNSWAKRITKKAIQVLNSEDLVGAMAQTMNGDEWIFELTPAAKYAELVPLINNAEIGDMGTFGTTMQMGYDALVKCDASSRHMIIISDGDASPPTPELLGKLIESQISVSTVAVFPHNGDTRILEEIAGVTKGRFYYPNDPNQLPGIFIKEAKTLRRNQLQIRDFVPAQVNTDSMLKEITELPQLHGYVLTSPKEDPRATILLAAPPTEAEVASGDTEADPILAVWRYGLGVTAAFTSDLSERWGKDWVGWDQYQQLVTQIVTRISRTRREQYLRVYTYVNGNEGVVVVEDFHPTEALLDISLSVTGPNNFAQSQQIRQIAPRRYQTSMPLKGEGRYQVMIGTTRPGEAIANSGETDNLNKDGLDNDNKEKAYAGFIVSYSPEYLRFRSNPIALRDIAQKTGGVELVSDDSHKELANTIFGARKPKRSSRPIFDWFLMCIACLLPLDVAIRRVQMDLGWIKRLFRSNKRESTATMGALLERAGQVRSSMTSKERNPNAERPRTEPTVGRPMATRPPQQRPPATTTQNQESKPSTSTSPPASSPSTDGGTTSRLLEIKRKREQDGGKKE